MIILKKETMRLAYLTIYQWAPWAIADPVVQIIEWHVSSVLKVLIWKIWTIYVQW